MNRPRYTKIVATLGPASSSAEAIQALYEAGVRVFRLNFSHGTHEDRRRRAAAIRQIEDRYDDPVSILVDLQGPKLRFGNFENGGVVLKAGDSFQIDLSDEPGNESRGPLPHSEVCEALSMGTEILIDDGKVCLSVESVAKDHAITRVLVGGRVSDHKGVNLPNAILPIPILTEKDREDLEAGLDLGADWVALSFAQQPEDVAEAVAMMARIIDSVEGDPRHRSLLDAGHAEPESIGSDAITSAACRIARTLGASTVVTYTTSGSTALRAARERPDVPIMGLTPERQTARRLALSWGIVPIHTEDVTSVDEMVDKACAITMGRKLANIDEAIVITAGMPFGTPGTTNLLRLARNSEACSP